MRLGKPRYVDKFVKNPTEIKLESEEIVSVYALASDLTDDEKNEWAKHILSHYIKDSDINNGAKLMGLTRAEYIEKMILPSTELRKGSEVSGVFGELIFSDFIEFILHYQVPRYKLYETYAGNPNQGIDIIAYKCGPIKSKHDTVLYAEIKSRLKKKDFKVLQEAIDDISKRSEKEFSLALDVARRKLKTMGYTEEADQIARFEDSESPCVRLKFAGLITNATACDADSFAGVCISAGTSIETHVIHSTDLWNLVQDLWRRACA